MNRSQNTGRRQDNNAETSPRPSFVLSFDEIGSTMLAEVGGKASNLGQLTRAGFPVPPGFCIGTAAYTEVAEEADLSSVLAALAETQPDDTSSIEYYARQARELLRTARVTPHLQAEITAAYQELTGGEPIPVAVRSSATAEDLPFASFAGQQETYLNVMGVDDLLEATRNCWASLWTDRAVKYRATNGIDHAAVRLAVVVQRMVAAGTAGVLFTADPLSGRRHRAVIDASPGLGEAVVSGAVNPDQFTVDKPSGEIVTRRLGDKRLAVHSLPEGGTEHVESGASADPCLTDDQVLELARLGARVEEHYGSPQDTEWAIDTSGRVWLTQARPITTLFPLPAGTPDSTQDLRVYWSINVFQGVYRPFTPMGLAGLRLVCSSMARLFGREPDDVTAGPSVAREAGHRLFLDMTPALRSTVGRKVIPPAMSAAEARSRDIFRELFSDPRLAPAPPRWQAFLPSIATALVRARVPFYLAQGLISPEARWSSARRVRGKLEQRYEKAELLPAHERLDLIERTFVETMAPTMVGTACASMLTVALMERVRQILGDLASPDELQTVLRGLPNNPTMEMDLELWRLVAPVREDDEVRRLFREATTEELRQRYRAGTLPAALQQALNEFLGTYGHRGVAEIDIGLPHWSEDPTHVLNTVAGYLELDDLALKPDVLFERGKREAHAMVAQLSSRARTRGRLRGAFVGLVLRRARGLFGLREMHKFLVAVQIESARRVLWTVGEELAETGRVDDSADIFFLDLNEARQALNGTNFSRIVKDRRSSYEQEMKRRRIPRVLLSDGTQPEDELLAAGTGPTEGTLVGTPGSSGVVTAKARVILDPEGARLEPGEILVAPSTDPGWTSLFLTAGAVAMEMGGANSHGAVVAREYGIPAVVGVPGLTDAITKGQVVTVDGSSGTVTTAHADNTTDTDGSAANRNSLDDADA